MKCPIVKTKEFTIYLEELNYNMFIHCDVNVKWSKDIKKNCHLHLKN